MLHPERGPVPKEKKVIRGYIAPDVKVGDIFHFKTVPALGNADVLVSRRLVVRRGHAVLRMVKITIEVIGK